MTRILLRDLEPGRNYAIQARANNGDQFSQWSQLWQLTTIADTMPPAAPTDLTWEVEGTAFKAVWTGPVTNEDGTPLRDFKDFQVTLFSPAAPSTRAVYYTTAARFDFTFENNFNSFGTPRSEVSIEIKARDNTGNLSDAITASATNPPPSDVTGLSVVGIIDAVALRWDAVSDTDFKHYRVYQGTTAGVTPNLVYTGPGNSFVFDTNSSVEQFFAVYAYDVFNTQSVNAATGSATPKSSLGTDTQPPDNVSNVTLATDVDGESGIAFIDVSWTGVTDSDLQNYIVRYSTVDGSGWQYINVPEGTTSVRINGLKPGTEYYVGVATVDYSANSSGVWVNSATDYPITTAADTVAPSQPAAPSVAANTMQIQVSHDGTRDIDGTPLETDLSHFEVYAFTASDFTPSSGNMIGRIDKGPAMVAAFPVPASADSGTAQSWYAKVIAVDLAGNKSAPSVESAASVPLVSTVNIGDATITDAKIGSVAADKLIAGTGIINDLSVKSALTIDTGGFLRSSNYDALAKTGYELSESGLIVNDGQISARALLLQNGNNVMHPAYADFEFQATWYENEILLGGGGGSWAIVSEPEVTPRFNTQAIKLSWDGSNSTYSRILFGPTGTSYNVPVEQNSDYIFSVYLRTPPGSGPKSINLMPKKDTGAYHTHPLDTVVDDGTWQRFSTVVSTGSSTKILPTIALNTPGDLYIDGVQVERKQTAEIAPSQWKPPSTTSIDGGIIRTGEIRSSATANGLSGQPAWSINMAGSAQFGDAMVRGRLVIGDPDNPGVDGANSRVLSSNYVPGSSGWIIRSDGYAEFRDLAVNSIKVTAFDSPFQNSSNAKMYDYMQDDSLWVTDGFVTKVTDPGAYSAESLFEFTGPGAVLRNATGVKPIAFDPTVLYRVSARVRAYEVATLNIDPDFEDSFTITDWDTNTNATLVWDNAKSYAGAASMRIDDNATGTGPYSASTDIWSISPGYTYTFNGRVLPNSENARDNIAMNISWLDNAGVVISSELVELTTPVDESGVPLPVDGVTWFSISAQAVAPEGAVRGRFEFQIGADAIANAGTVAWIDQALITTPPRIRAGLFGLDEAGDIVDYDHVDELTTPSKTHPMPANPAELPAMAGNQYMVISDNREIQVASGDGSTTSDWLTYTGYIRGRGGTGTDGLFGTPDPHENPYNPGSVNHSVRYLVPYVEFDIAPGSKAQLDQFSIEAFENGAPKRVATSEGPGVKAVTIENNAADSSEFDHALRFYTGDSDELFPGVIGHTLDGDQFNAAHLRLSAPTLNADNDGGFGKSHVGIWDKNPNFIYNSTFENGIDRWTAGNSSPWTSVEWEETVGREDTNSLKVTAINTPWVSDGVQTPYSTAFYDILPWENPDIIGKQLVCSAYLMSINKNIEIKLRVNFMNADGTIRSAWYLPQQITTTEWGRIAFLVPDVVPSDIAAVRVFPYFFEADVEGGVVEAGDGFYVDDIQAEVDNLTSFRSAAASHIGLNAEVVTSTGSIVMSDSNQALPDILSGDQRKDVPRDKGLIIQTATGTGAFTTASYTDNTYGTRASTSLTMIDADGTEGSYVRIYSAGDGRYPGQVALTSPNGDFALSTEPKDGALDQRFNVRVHGGLVADGDAPWIPVTPTNVGSVYSPFGYYKSNGIVYLRGIGENPSMGDLFTLPEGYRPAENAYLPTAVFDGTGSAKVLIVRVGTAGVVSAWSTGGDIYSTGSITLQGLSFPITQISAPPPTGDTTAPGQVSGFDIDANSSGSSSGSYKLSWTNPSSSDLRGVKIIWRSDRYPNVNISGSGTKTMSTDGNIITVTGSPGANKNYTHSGLPVNRTIYYRVVAYDRSGNHSEYVSKSRYLLASPVTITANGTDSYRLGYGGMWRNDGDEIYQGDWTGNDNHRGCLFYGTKIYDTLSKGGVVRKPTKMTVNLRRTTSSHGYNSGVGINLRGLKLRSKPSGDPIGHMNNESSDGNDIVYLSRGERATVTVPSSWYNNFVLSDSSNRLEGLAVYGSGKEGYAIMYGRNNSSLNGKITIYHKG